MLFGTMIRAWSRPALGRTSRQMIQIAGLHDGRRVGAALCHARALTPSLVVARHKIRDCIALVGTDIDHHWRLYWKTLCKLIEPGVSRTAFANQGAQPARPAMHRCCCCCCWDDLGKKHSSGAGRARAGDIRRASAARRAQPVCFIFYVLCFDWRESCVWCCMQIREE